MNQIEAIKKAEAILREAFPDNAIGLQIWCDNSVQVQWHGTRTYAEAVEWFRSLGCQQRNKTPYGNYTQLDGTAHGIRWTTFPNELPPTCHKVKKVERIPKTQTIQTGEFVEIEREVVECGPDPDEIVAMQARMTANEPDAVPENF